jgi:ATP phosphoribosyltransferase regulatory subunit HisZ
VSALVEAARFNRPIEAELCRMFLESHGVDALVFDAQSYLYAEGALVGVRVMVLEEDLPEAERVLRDYDA